MDFDECGIFEDRLLVIMLRGLLAGSGGRR